GDGMSYFREALDKRVIVVPGEFFDVNPGKRRAGRPSRFRQHVRLSFGPPLEALERALPRLGVWSALRFTREQKTAGGPRLRRGPRWRAKMGAWRLRPTCWRWGPRCLRCISSTR